MRVTHQVLLELRKIRGGAGNLGCLAKFQEMHQRLYVEAYGLEKVRPKHHLRMHLPTIYEKGGYVDCWATEARHRLYKGSVAGDIQALLGEANGKFSKAALVRMINSVCEEQLTWGAALAGEVFPAEQVLRETGIEARMSAKFRFNSCVLQKGDVLLWHDSEEAALVGFFLEHGPDRFSALATRLHGEPGDTPCRTYMPGNQLIYLPLEELQRSHRPLWWLRQDSGAILVLQ